MQVGARFQQVRCEAVTKHVGIDLLLNPGTAGGMLASVAWGFGIHGLIAGVPAIPWPFSNSNWYTDMVERLNEDQERIDLKNSEQHQRLEQSTQTLHLVANIDAKRRSSVKANLC